MNLKKSFLRFCALLLFLSCGKAGNDKSDEKKQELPLEGTYSATLIAVNQKVSSRVNGEVQISRYGDLFTVKIELKDAPSGPHKQQLHLGSNCPNINHDQNGDGYTDMRESREYLGDTVLPFDDDLSSYYLGSTFIPHGSYRYLRSTSYHLMLSDLDVEGDLLIENRAVSILGDSPVGEVPIACGVFKKISDLPPSDQWEEEPPAPQRPSPSPQPPRARPLPSDISPAPVEPTYTTWWERLRQRWQNWRERIQDWWSDASV